MLVDTAVDAVEKMEGGKAVPEKVKVLNLSYKGMVQPAVVRQRKKGDKVCTFSLLYHLLFRVLQPRVVLVATVLFYGASYVLRGSAVDPLFCVLCGVLQWRLRSLHILRCILLSAVLNYRSLVYIYIIYL